MFGGLVVKAHKVCGLHVVTLLKQRLIFVWYMARLVVMNGHYK